MQKISDLIELYKDRDPARCCFFNIEENYFSEDESANSYKDKASLKKFIDANKNYDITGEAFTSYTIQSSVFGDIYQGITNTIIPESIKKKYNNSITLSSYDYHRFVIELEMTQVLLDTYPELDQKVKSKVIHEKHNLVLSRFEKHLLSYSNHVITNLSSMDTRILCDEDELLLIDFIRDLDFYHLVSKQDIVKILKEIGF